MWWISRNSFSIFWFENYSMCLEITKTKGILVYFKILVNMNTEKWTEVCRTFSLFTSSLLKLKMEEEKRSLCFPIHRACLYLCMSTYMCVCVSVCFSYLKICMYSTNFLRQQFKMTMNILALCHVENSNF